MYIMENWPRTLFILTGPEDFFRSPMLPDVILIICFAYICSLYYSYMY